MAMTYSDLLRQARRVLLPTEGEQRAGEVSRELVQFATGKTFAELVADGFKYPDQAVVQHVGDLLRRTIAGEPLAYLLGEWEFYGLKLLVTKDVLIPRDDTCALTEEAIKQAMFLDAAPRVLDLCTGSGCIGIAIASKVPDARVTLADMSREALNVAKQNVAMHHLQGRVNCIRADALGKPSPFLGQFDMIVSNPPYITDGDMETLDTSVRDYEPHIALRGGEDGLDFYRAIAANYRACLKPGGYLCFEFGEGQADDVCDILTANGFTVKKRLLDFNNTQRAVIAQIATEE